MMMTVKEHKLPSMLVAVVTLELGNRSSSRPPAPILEAVQDLQHSQVMHTQLSTGHSPMLRQLEDVTDLFLNRIEGKGVDRRWVTKSKLYLGL